MSSGSGRYSLRSPQVRRGVCGVDFANGESMPENEEVKRGAFDGISSFVGCFLCFSSSAFGDNEGFGDFRSSLVKSLASEKEKQLLGPFEYIFYYNLIAFNFRVPFLQKGTLLAGFIVLT